MYYKFLNIMFDVFVGIEKAMDSGIVSQQAKVDAEQRRIEESDRFLYICIYTYTYTYVIYVYIYMYIFIYIY
jgi:hypothetical protein